MSQQENSNVNVLKRDLLKFFLNNSVSKLPIKRSDITTNVFAKSKGQHKEIYQAAKNQLKEVYGIKVLEIPGSKNFICVSTVPTNSYVECPQNQRSELALLFIILSYIYMEGGSVKEDVLFRFLKKIGIEGDKFHYYFGDVKRLVIEVFPKQLYLSRVRDVNIDSEETFDISWGYRSTVEFPKKCILEEVAKLLDKKPEDFVSQYEGAMEESADEDDDDGISVEG